MVMTLLTRPKKTVATVVVAIDGSGDTTDIQTGINLLPADGGVVYIKEGTYELDAQITISNDDVAIIGAGRSTEIIVTGAAVTSGIYSTGVDGILIENLYVYGNMLASMVGIYINDSVGSSVNHCWVENCGWGIRILLSNNITISDNFSYSNNTGIQFFNADDSIMISNQVYENIYTGISITQGSSDNIILGNNVRDNDYNNTATYDGINVGAGSNNNIISSNRCKDNDRYEINIGDNTCNKNMVLGNVCVGTDHVGGVNDAGTSTHNFHNTI